MQNRKNAISFQNLKKKPMITNRFVYLFEVVNLKTKIWKQN